MKAAPAVAQNRYAPAQTYPAIDILRGFAALSVLVYHVIEHYKWTSFPTGGVLVWFRIGWIGVDLFLVISGFVISLSVHSLLQRLSYWHFLREFAERRMRRIVPLYLATCVVFVLFTTPYILPAPGFYKHVLMHAFFIQNLSIDYHGSIDGPNWSVALEMQFYLMAALLAPVLFRVQCWRVALVALLVSWAWRAAAILLIHLDKPLSVYRLFIAATELPGTLDEFAVGFVLARLVLTPAGARLLAWGQRLTIVPVGLAALAVWTLLAVYWSRPSFWDVPAMVIVWRTTCALTFGLVLLAACCFKQPWFLVASAPLRYLGTISFGIYLWHLPVLMAIQRIEWLAPEIALTYILAGTLVLAAGSWHMIEKPALRRAG